MRRLIEDREILKLETDENGTKEFILMPSSCKNNRKRRGVAQPKCHVGVCRKSCPYRDKPFRVDIVRLANGSDAVCLLKEMRRCEWSSCIVMYLNGTCEVGDKSIEKDVFSFMRGHVARVMMDCPLRMEHLMSGWSNERRS